MVLLQARDIMRICNLGTSKFKYIVQKIGIPADIKKASGPGTMNIYSFEALMCFAIAMTCLGADWKHKTVREVIFKLKNLNNTGDCDLFNIDIESSGKIECLIKLNEGSVTISLSNTKEDPPDVIPNKEGYLYFYINPHVKAKDRRRKDRWIRGTVAGNPSFFKENKPHLRLVIDLGLMKEDLKKKLGE